MGQCYLHPEVEVLVAGPVPVPLGRLAVRRHKLLVTHAQLLERNVIARHVADLVQRILGVRNLYTKSDISIAAQIRVQSKLRSVPWHR